MNGKLHAPAGMVGPAEVGPLPVGNQFCRRCGSKDIAYLPESRRVVCVECAVKKAVRDTQRESRPCA